MLNFYFSLRFLFFKGDVHVSKYLHTINSGALFQISLFNLHGKRNCTCKHCDFLLGKPAIAIKTAGQLFGWSEPCYHETSSQHSASRFCKICHHSNEKHPLSTTVKNISHELSIIVRLPGDDFGTNILQLPKNEVWEGKHVH